MCVCDRMLCIIVLESVTLIHIVVDKITENGSCPRAVGGFAVAKLIGASNLQFVHVIFRNLQNVLSLSR